MTTTIEWTDTVWNPVRGCSLVSAGCANCYAMKQAHRFSGPGQPYEGLTEIGPQGPRWNGKVRLVPELLDAPLHWKKPRRIFVNSMSDLFHEDVPHDFIFRVFRGMARCQQHTFQVLTKRPERMLDFCRRIAYIEPGFNGHDFGMCSYWPNDPVKHPIKARPLPNVWLGVSIEDQQTADERIPLLLQTPTAVRWVSAEPLLGAVDLERGGFALHRPMNSPTSGKKWPGLDWVVVGGESGPGARPCDIGHIRNIVQQCKTAGVACFVKQLGARPIVSEVIIDTDRGIAGSTTATGLSYIKDKKGGDPAEWPEDLRVREWTR